MRKIVLLIISGILALQAGAQFKPLEKGSKVEFKIKNFGFNVTGSFSGLEGDIKFDPSKPENGKFDVSIDAATVNTDNNARDHHLKEESYFDVQKFPRIHFVSTKLSGGDKNGGSYKVTGNLTIKGKTKEISFPFTATESAGGLLFKGSFPLNRREFDVGGSSTISDHLEVMLTVQAEKK
jgi:polyisoprenoid-binding protein YceI